MIVDIAFKGTSAVLDSPSAESERCFGRDRLTPKLQDSRD